MAEKREITTKAGFVCMVDEDAFDDIRIFELMSKYDNCERYEQIKLMPEILDLFIGADQKESMYEYLTEKEVRPKITSIEKEMASIINGLSKRKKNSSACRNGST